MKTVYSILAITLVLAAFLNGCGRERASNEVIMWLVGSEAQSKSVNDLAARFMSETGIKVRCEAISWGEAHSKYLTSVAGGVAPDIGTMGLTWGAEFGELGAMVDLKKEFPGDLPALEKETFKGMWESIKYRDKVYGIPLDMTFHVLYYRNDMIAEPPRTWQELSKLLESLKTEGKGMLFDWGSMEWIGYSPYLWQAGGDYYSAGQASCALDSPEAMAGMRYFTGLYGLYNVPKTPIPLEQGMRIGDFPVCISGNWKIIGLTVSAPEISGKWSIATLPKGPSGKQTAFLGGRMMGIFSQSVKKHEAWQFMKFLYRPVSQVYLYSQSVGSRDAYLPPNTASWAQLDMQPEFKKVLIAQALDAKGPPPVLGWDNLSRLVDQAVQKIVLRGADVEDEMRALKNLIDLESKKRD